MRGLASASPGASLRARRWDAIVLGGALPGLVTAARLGMDGLRVLVVEEEAAARAHPALREPFFLAGANGGVLDACLRMLTVPLIERRKIEPDAVAYQVALPQMRIDVGEPQLTIEELVGWGLAKPDAARDLVRALQEGAAAERAAMLEAPVVRGGMLRSLARAGAPMRPAIHGRGLALEAASPPEALAPFLDAQVRALSNLGSAPVPPEARARLLGAALEGGAGFGVADGFLRGLLRRRCQALFGEFRTVSGPFELQAVGAHPGIAIAGSRDVWLGRVVVLNAPRASLAAALAEDGAEVPSLLNATAATHRRMSLHFRAPRSVLPEGMARRVVHVADPGRPLEGTNLVTLALQPSLRGDESVEVVASAVLPAEAAASGGWDAEVEAAVRSLMPFSEGRLQRERSAVPRWDHDGSLGDPRPGEGWPGDVEIRASSRPPIYALDREGVAALGVEGDLLLGWRAAEAIRAELV